MKFKYNIYLCERCGHAVTTRDVHAGTTPFKMACTKLNEEGESDCNGNMTSLGYPTPFPAQAPLLEFEWYMPKSLKRLSPDLKEHVRKGGLVRRPVEDKNQLKLPLRPQRRRNTARNQPCPCGSKLKYKKCCALN